VGGTDSPFPICKLYHKERKKTMKKIIPFQAIALLFLVLNKNNTILYYAAVLLLSLSLLLNSLYELKRRKK